MGIRGEVCSQQVSHYSQLTFKDNSTQFESWPVPSRLLVNPPEERLPGSSWPPRLPGNLPPAPEVSRSPTDTDLVPWLSEKSEDTRSLLSFSSENCPSSVLLGRSPRTSRLTSGSSLPLSVPCRRPARLT